MIKVLLVEPQTLLREGLHALLKTANNLEIVAAEASGRDAIRLAAKLKPNVVLMRARMPDLAGVEVARQINASHPEIRILILLAGVTRQEVNECLREGVAGIVHDNSSFAELHSAIHTVARGESHLSPAIANVVGATDLRRARAKRIVSDVELLSKRELDVLRLIAEGNVSTEIAKALHISARTVDTHRQNIINKLGIHSIAGLTKFSLRHGLTSL